MHKFITMHIDHEASHVSMILNCAVISKEIAEIGLYIRSTLLHYERKINFLGGWSNKHFYSWKICHGHVAASVPNKFCCEHDVFGFVCPNVATPGNLI